MKTSGTQNHTLFTTSTLGGGERYWFGFNGAELENEIYGEGNAYDLGLRMYDARLARMFSIDPRTPEYPWQSPYVYHRNRPIAVIDFMGGGDDDLKELASTSHSTSNESFTKDGVKIEETIETMNTVYKNTKTGDYILKETINRTFTSYDSNNDIITSSQMTSSTMTNMSQSSGDGKSLVGVGVYGDVNASFVGATFDANAIRFNFFNEPGKTYLMTSVSNHGAGWDLGASVGFVFIFGSKDMKPTDLTGLGSVVSGGYGFFDGFYATSMKVGEGLTFDYHMIGVGMGISVPGGAINNVYSRVKLAPPPLISPVHLRTIPYGPY